MNIPYSILKRLIILTSLILSSCGAPAGSVPDTGETTESPATPVSTATVAEMEITKEVETTAPPAQTQTATAEETATVPVTEEITAPPPTPSTNVSVFATGLVYPRGLKFGPDGNLYVAESGNGGETESMGTCEGFTSMFVPYHIGNSAQISKISPAGELEMVADGLPSARDKFGDVLGVSDVIFIDDTLYATVYGGGCSRGFADFPSSIVQVSPEGEATIIADLSAFYAENPTAAPAEEDYEPDGSANSVDVLDGKLYVVNANHGALDEVTLDGQVRRVIDLTATEGHVTPATVVAHEGNLYLGALGEFPIQAGVSKVYQVTPQGKLSVFAEGLTAVLGLAFDDTGRLYVLETSTADGEMPLPGAGRVVRVGEGGELEEIATGLTYAFGLAFGPDGSLYVSQYAFGGDPTKGEVVRIDLSAVP